MRKLEQEYSRELAVVGVHSLKFPTERETANVRNAVRRYGLQHPVVSDADFLVWQQYACRAWPTLMFVDPQGKVIGKHEGEISHESLDRILGQMIAQFDGQGLLDRNPLSSRPEPEPQTDLLYPGKVLSDAAGGRLFIADSNHHRILMSSLAGEVQQVIGSGHLGMADGGFASASFNHPQGMALVRDSLYVADTENHALRRLDLASQTVKTIAGTGEQAQVRGIRGPGLATSLSSPWNLVAHNGTLYIAMAGSHQIWSLGLGDDQVTPYAGSGLEAIIDEALASAALAQPSGITTDGTRLYFADSETSSIRYADLDPAGQVGTIVGLGLFVFGDMDGVGQEVRLQHPIGISHFQGKLYAGDTYNHKIKLVDPEGPRMSTLAGTGEPSHRDGPADQASFNEPSGITICPRTSTGPLVYIADTNNHSVRVMDLGTKSVSTLELRGL